MGYLRLTSMSSISSMLVLSFNYLTHIVAASWNTTRLLWAYTTLLHKKLFILRSVLCFLKWDLAFSKLFCRVAKCFFKRSLYTAVSYTFIMAISYFAFSSFNRKVFGFFSICTHFSFLGWCLPPRNSCRNWCRLAGDKSLVSLITYCFSLSL